MDFQSIAYTKSAKAPLPCCPRWIRTTTCRSRICRANHYTIGHHRAETKGFEPLRRCRLPVFRTGAINQLCQISIQVTRERFELPTSTFVASCSNPTELTSHNQRKQEDSNLWNLSVQHVSSVPLSTTQPYFLRDLTIVQFCRNSAIQVNLMALTAPSFRLQRYGGRMKPFFVSEKIFRKSCFFPFGCCVNGM